MIFREQGSKKEIDIDVNHISSFRGIAKGAVVTTDTGKQYIVDDSYRSIVKRLREIGIIVL